MESRRQPCRRGLILFFTLTLSWIGVGGGVAILVAHGFMDFSRSPLVLVSMSGLMPILAALGAAGVEAGRDGAALAEMISVLGALLVTGMVSGASTGFAMQRLRAASTLESAITHPQSTRQSTFG